MTIRWGGLILGAALGAILANIRTGGTGGGGGGVPPTDQNKKAGWST